MIRLALALALATSICAHATPITQPSKIQHAEGRAEYHFPIDEKMAPLVVVVPDTTVPMQRITIINKTAPAPVLKITGSLDGAVLPGGVKSAKEALEVWNFASSLEKTEMDFTMDETLKLGKSSEAKLILDLSKTSDKDELAGSNKKGEKIQISRVVVAKILAPDFNVIEVINDGRQVLNPNGPTEWRWSLTPKKVGEYKVNVTVAAVIEIGTDHAERLVKVYNQEVTVFVTPADVVKYFFTKNWQWLWSTLVLPFGLWIWKKRNKKDPSDADLGTDT